MRNNGAYISAATRGRINRMLRPFGLPMFVSLPLFFVTTIVFCVFYVNAGIKDLKYRNCMAASLIGLELKLEYGPVDSNIVVEHLTMLRQYVKYMDEKHLAPIAKILGDETRIGLEKAEIELATAQGKSGTQAKHAINQAGAGILEACELYLTQEWRERVWIRLFKREVVSKELLASVHNAIDEANTLADNLRKAKERGCGLEREQKLAQLCCMANRRAILLLFLIRHGHQDAKPVARLLVAVTKAQVYTDNLAREVEKEDPEAAKRLRGYALSEKRRIDILTALLSNDVHEACQLLKEAIYNT